MSLLYAVFETNFVLLHIAVEKTAEPFFSNKLWFHRFFHHSTAISKIAGFLFIPQDGVCDRVFVCAGRVYQKVNKCAKSNALLFKIIDNFTKCQKKSLSKTLKCQILSNLSELKN